MASSRTKELQLLEYLEKVFSCKSQHKFAIYFDYEKAFDKVPHPILVEKLRRFKLDGNFCTLLESYLCNRYQLTQVNKSKLKLLPCLSGVQQGSVLGPFLFLVFVNDLPSIFLDSMVWLFADDFKMLFTNLNIHEDLWRLYSWNICNGMIANACKSKCLHFNGSAKISTAQHEVLENVSSDKDLGVYISNDLQWGFHVTSKLCKARQCFFSLKAKIPFNTPFHVKLHLYRSLVLSVLLYGFPAWYPDVSMLKKLENFQRSCFLRIFGRKSSYLKQVKDNNFLPLCYQLEYITFSFLSQLMLDK